MKKISFFFFVLSNILCCSVLSALEVPDYDGFVTDNADILSTKQEERLEQKLVEYEQRTSNEIAVLIIESLEGEVLEHYSIQVVDKWGPGKADRDNGVLLLISKNDRKIRLEVGDGLTGALTDMMSGRVIDGEISPRFKEGDFYEGIDDGLNLIIQIIDGEFTAEDYQKEQKTETLFFVFVIAAVTASFFGMFHWIAGGITGGVLGAIIGAMFFGFFGSILGIIIGAIVGIIGGFIMQGMAESSGGSGGGFSGGSGGGSSGGSSFSFGGGGFSGGGASGGW